MKFNNFVIFFQILEPDQSRTPIVRSRNYISPGRLIEMNFIANNSLGENSFEVEYKAGKISRVICDKL